jgi:hypothetical protein
MGRETKDSSFQPRLSVKAAAENRYQSCFPVVCGVTNPSANPIPEAVSHFFISRWYSTAFRERLISSVSILLAMTPHAGGKPVSERLYYIKLQEQKNAVFFLLL